MSICFRVKVANDFYNSGQGDFNAVCALRRMYFCNSTWLAGQAARVLLNTRGEWLKIYCLPTSRRL